MHRRSSAGMPLVAYPRGTLCAGLGLLLVFGYYLLGERTRRYGTAASRATESYPASDSRYWTSRPDLLIGVSMSALFLAAAMVADLVSGDALEWALRMFCALLGAAAFTMLLVGCIFLGRHWIEAIGELRERPPDLCEQFTQTEAESGRYAMAPMRSHLLRQSLLGLCAMFFVAWVAAKLGIMPERLLDNPVVGAIYGHLVWIFILTFVVVLWTTRGRFAALLRLAVLLIFSLIIVPATLFFVSWLASLSGLLVVILCASIVALNIVFFYRLERARL